MSAAGPLPITVVLPTRNAMGAIESHLAEIREWLPLVAQIVVVDSSEDGTLDFLRHEIALPTTEFHARPRGLYEGWNFGMRQATQEFVYFSTVGDSIGEQGLRGLLELARRHAADIAISPPAMFDEHGQALPLARWPVHELCGHMAEGADRILSPAESFILSSSFVPLTLLGSSASNLYRRSFLAAHPFLEGWGHCADSAWMMENCLLARTVVTSRCVSKFIIHPKDPSVASRPIGMSHYEDMFGRARSALRASALGDADKELLAGWLDALQERYKGFFQRLEANVGHLARRDARIKELGESLAASRVRATQFEAELRDSNRKVIDLRRDLGAYERIHRSLPGMIGLYFSVKWSQARKAWALLRRRSQKPSA